MQTSLTHSCIDAYWQYLEQTGATLSLESLPRLAADLEVIAWEEPESAIDLNNFAVLMLIEAERCADLGMRTMHLELALEALQNGSQHQISHPLCIAHLALVQCMIGETQAAIATALPTFLNLQQVACTSAEPQLGLIYLPLGKTEIWHQRLQYLLQAENGWVQAMQLLTEVLRQAQLVFYNSSGMRFLHLAQQFTPHSAELHLKLGISNLMCGNWEGLFNLQEARKLAPNYAPNMQALYLAYRTLEDLESAVFWLESARQKTKSLEWCWAGLEVASPFTYLPFEGLPLAVEPTLRSIVTLVLLAEGDWFEAEMEFWRQQIQPGMTVLDVGANVGVYTFSAAKQVGSTGRVLAVEPFSGCVQCLQESRRINQMDWITICAGAASDRTGTAHLSLHTASELNEIVMDNDTATNGCEEVACFTLDSLIEQHNITQVDWLKIDAEGHEIPVLEGSIHLIEQFSPGILYENIAGSKGSNLSVAKWLQAKNYRLFRFQPYLQNLIPIDSLEEMQGSLNIIALPPNHSLL
jgi:FkbM family methyltransferase